MRKCYVLKCYFIKRYSENVLITFLQNEARSSKSSLDFFPSYYLEGYVHEYVVNKGTSSFWNWMVYWKRCIEGWSIESYRWIDWFTKLPPIKLWRKEKGVDVTTGGLQIHLIFFLSALKVDKMMDWNLLRKGLTWVQFAPVMEVQSFLIYPVFNDRY